MKIFQRLAISSLALIALLMPFVSPAKAYDESSTFSYQVNLRGNGEAVVHAYLNVINKGSSTLSSYSFEKASGEFSDVVVTQSPVYNGCYPYDYSTDSSKATELIAPCGTIPSTTNSPLNITTSGSTYSFKLNQPVAVGSQMMLTISYVATGYVKNQLGLHSFNFPTLKLNERIGAVSAVVSADSGFYLRGKQSTIDYNSSNPYALTPSSVSSYGSASYPSSYYPYTRQPNTVYREARDLGAHETLNVTGQYSSSWLRLYLTPILATIFVLIALGALVLSYLRSRNITFSAGQLRFTPAFLWTLGGALIGALLLFGLSRLQNAYYSNLMSSINFNDYSTYELTSMLTSASYLIVALIPAAIILSKFNWKWAFTLVVLEFIILIIAVYGYVIYRNHNQSITQTPYPASSTYSPYYGSGFGSGSGIEDNSLSPVPTAAPSPL